MRKMLTNLKVSVAELPQSFTYYSQAASCQSPAITVSHLRRKADVIAPHTNQHNLCNYALKVTLEAENDVSGLDSGGGSVDSPGGFQPRGEETSHFQTKLLTPAVTAVNTEKRINQAEVITMPD